MKLTWVGVVILGCLSSISLRAAVPAPLSDDPSCTAADRGFMKQAYALANEAMKKGNPPFGALLVVDGKVVAQAINTTDNSKDSTRHAELSLISKIGPKLDHNALNRAVLYTSSEPCVMCCGAILNGGIVQVVYGTSESQFQKIIDESRSKKGLTCREIMARSGNRVKVKGPLMEKEGLAIHQAYWPDAMKRWAAKK